MIDRINTNGAKPVRLKPCKLCGHLGHTAFTCPKKKRKPMQRSRMKPISKVGRQTMAENKAFIDSFKDDELYCYYYVYIGIEVLLLRNMAQAEHFMSRVHHPELRSDPSNKVIACGPHNKQKGSLDGPEFLKILDKEMEAEK